MATTLLLHAKHRGTEVTYQPFGPWIVPWRYESLEAEYGALRTGAGLIDYSTQALIEVRGADRVSFLQNLLTNDIKRLTPGTGCRAALLTPAAKLIADLLLFADAESLWLMCDLQRADVVAKALDRYLFSEQVTMRNHERQAALLTLQGPRTMEALASVAGAAVSLPHPGDHQVVTIDGMTVRLMRWSVTGEVGILCLVEADQAGSFWHLCQERGRRAGLRLVGWEALNTARIEAGIPWFGIDMDEENLLPETGLEATAVSDTKGCYLGQEIIARLSTYGSMNKKLMGLLVDGDQAPEAGNRITRRDDEVGWVTSACYSPALKRPIAMGYVKRGSYDAGTAVDILHGGAKLPAIVSAYPLVQSIVHRP